jgi:isoleucyl-tRNA synthetase
MAQQVPEKISFPLEEEKVQAYWKSIDAFKTSLKQSKGKPKYVHTYITVNASFIF